MDKGMYSLKLTVSVYKEDEEAMYTPHINRPDYGRGFYFMWDGLL